MKRSCGSPWKRQLTTYAPSSGTVQDSSTSTNEPRKAQVRPVSRGFGTPQAAGLIILNIGDVTRPQLVGRLDFAPPFIPNIAVHSVLPLTGRGIAVVNSEAIASRGNEPLNHASTVDISDPSKPRLLATFPLPQPPPGAPFDSFYDRGGRFGPHNTSMLYHSPYTDHSDKLIYLTYFNAGLRIVDIEDPRNPREVGYFLPPDPVQRFGPQPPDALVLQSEDVLVDKRGNIYLSNKNQGLWILRYSDRPQH
jgi:hypothetical protein